MTEGSRVLVSRRVPVGTARAFEAFTAEIGRWWRPNGLFQFTEGRSGVLSFEPGPSGRLVETYDDGSVFVVGEVRAWEPPHRLVIGWRHASFAPGQDTELRVRFDAVDAVDAAAGAAGPAGAAGTAPQTRVTVEHIGWDHIPPEHAARHGIPLGVFQRRFAEWWQSMLERCSMAAP